MCHPVCISDGRTEQKLSGTLGKLILVILCWFFFFFPPRWQKRLLGDWQSFSPLKHHSVAQDSIHIIHYFEF